MRTLAAAVSICLSWCSVASAAPGDKLYARPGQLVSAQGTRLNFYCMGRARAPSVCYQPANMGSTNWIRRVHRILSSSFVIDAIREVYTLSK